MITVKQAQAELKKDFFRISSCQMYWERYAFMSFMHIKEMRDNVSGPKGKVSRYQVRYFTGNPKALWASEGCFQTLGETVKFAKTVYAGAKEAWEKGYVEACVEPVQEQQAQEEAMLVIGLTESGSLLADVIPVQEVAPAPMTKSEMFKEAHRMAKAWRANPDTVHTYKEAFAVALKIVWTAAKYRARQAA